MAQEWDIQTRDDACSACTQPFEDKQVYCSTLHFDRAGYTRRDFCEPCWAKEQSNEGSYSTWRGVFLVPPAAADEPLKKENAESLLRKLMGDDDASHLNTIYILAIMLERKRLLIERDVKVRDDGTMIRVYEHRGTGETFLILDPRLQLDQLEAVQEEVVVLLGGKPRSAATPPEPHGAGGFNDDNDEDEEDEDDA